MKFVNSKYNSIVPIPKNTDIDKSMIDSVNVVLKEYTSNLESCKLRNGLRSAMDVSSLGNVYLQDNKLDNNLFLNNRERCDTVIYNSINLIYLLSALMYPFMPDSSASICNQLKLPMRRLVNFNTSPWECDDVTVEHNVGKATYLFKIIDESLAEKFREKYGGQKKKEDEKKVDQAILDVDISAQAEVVRKLKAEKGDAALIKAEVAKLLSLKKLKV